MGKPGSSHLSYADVIYGWLMMMIYNNRCNYVWFLNSLSGQTLLEKDLLSLWNFKTLWGHSQLSAQILVLGIFNLINVGCNSFVLKKSGEVFFLPLTWEYFRVQCKDWWVYLCKITQIVPINYSGNVFYHFYSHVNLTYTNLKKKKNERCFALKLHSEKMKTK